MDHVFIKKENPYNYNENKHKIHLSDGEINTINCYRSYVPWHQVNPTGRLSSQAVCSIRVLFFSLTVLVLFNRLHRLYAVCFQISDFALSNKCTFFNIGILGIQGIQGFHCFQAFATQSVPKLPLNKIFQCGLAANNTTCVCVGKYFERLRRNAPCDRNPNTLKYKTTDSKNFVVCHVTRPCPCMTTSIIIR